MLKVKNVENRYTAFTREFTVTYEGKDYSGWLFWNENDGAWIDWVNVKEPEWAQNWDDENEDELVTFIENLTDEKLYEQECGCKI